MFSRRFVGWISCISVFQFFSKLFCFFMFFFGFRFAEVRGLDILYFVFFSKLFCFFLLFLFSLRGGSWAGCPVFLFFSFSRSFSVSLCCFLCFRLVYLSFCIYNRTNTYNNIQTHKKLRDKHKQQKQHKYIISQPEPENCLFAVGTKAGYPVSMFLFKCLFSCKKVHDNTCNMFTYLSIA